MSFPLKRYRISRKYEADIFNFFFSKKKFHFKHVGQFLLKLTLERARVKFTNSNVLRPDLLIPKKIDRPHSMFLWRLIYRNRLRCHFRLKARALKALLSYPNVNRNDNGKNFTEYFDGRLDHNMISHYFCANMTQARHYINGGFMHVNDVAAPRYVHYAMKSGDCFCINKTSRIGRTFLGIFYKTVWMVAHFVTGSYPDRTESVLPMRRFKFWTTRVYAEAASIFFDPAIRFIYNISRSFHR
jgi:hypothetical protein